MKLVIFGAGKRGRKLCSFKLKKGVEIVLLCDNGEEICGTDINGYIVGRPNEIYEYDYDYIIVTPTAREVQNEIRQQLKRMCIPRGKIIYTYTLDLEGVYENKLDNFWDIPKKPIIPFKKGPADIYSKYQGETYKSHNRRVKEGFFDKYCKGEGLDIGYGADLVVPGCSGWDLRNGDAQFLKGIEDESFDFVYSSHCLEHMTDVRISLKNWFRVVRKGGYLLIAIPHRDLYEKVNELPSRWNGDHKHMFLIGREELPDTLDIVEEIKQSLSGYDIKYIKTCDEGHTINDPLVHSDGEYQIEIVIQKTL